MRSNIDKSWTVFLDRDGVINREEEDDYIRSVDAFQFLPNVPEAIALLSNLVGRAIIVTNQKGIGKGLMTDEDLSAIHALMLDTITTKGGRIDQIYYCSAIDSSDPCRKPNTGMAILAQQAYPDIDFARSIMVGNTLSDMRFGKALGMHTVFILSEKPVPQLPHPDIDEVYPSLWTFANAL